MNLFQRITEAIEQGNGLGSVALHEFLKTKELEDKGFAYLGIDITKDATTVAISVPEQDSKRWYKGIDLSDEVTDFAEEIGNKLGIRPYFPPTNGAPFHHVHYILGKHSSESSARLHMRFMCIDVPRDRQKIDPNEVYEIFCTIYTGTNS